MNRIGAFTVRSLAVLSVLLMLGASACTSGAGRKAGLSTSPGAPPSAPGAPATATLPPGTSAPPATPTPAMPPSEGWIAFVDTAEVWLVHPDGSGLVQLTHSSTAPAGYHGIYGPARWSPDGSKIAFWRPNFDPYSGGQSEIYVVDIATGDMRLISQELGRDGFAWTASGQQVVYGTVERGIDRGSGDPLLLDLVNDGLWMVDIESRETTRLLESSPEFLAPHGPKSSPDGASLIFLAGGLDQPAGYGVMDLQSGVALPVPGTVSGWQTEGDCEWAPDGLSFACIVSASGNLPPTPDLADCVASPDGLTFTCPGGSAPDQVLLRLMDTQAKVTRDVALPPRFNIGTQLRWSPDGDKIGLSYSEGYDSTNNLIVHTDILSLSSGDFQPVGPGIISDWSPDGEWVILYSPPGAGQPEPPTSPMTLVHAATGASSPLPAGWSPVWQPPAGKGLVAAASQPGHNVASGGTPGAVFSACPSGDIASSYGTSARNAGTLLLKTQVDGQEVTYGPLAPGGFAEGPNCSFFVYCTNVGDCYAAHMGQGTLTRVGHIGLTAIRMDESPAFVFSWLGANPYILQIQETKYSEVRTLKIPASVSTEK